MNGVQAVVLGSRPADLLVEGGQVLVPGVWEFQKRDVVIVDGKIAALPEEREGEAEGEAEGKETNFVGEETTVLDADGRFVVPGFIDAHTHLDLHGTVERAYGHVLAGGTTTAVSEVSGFGPAFGATGVREFLAATDGLPLDVRVTVPPQPLIDTFEPAWADEAETEALCDLLTEERVVGVGETDWIHVVGRDVPAGVLYERARREGKPIAGHGAGCSGAKLAAFASVVDDDHEAITGEQAVERLANGLHVIGRSGSIRDDAAAVADAYQRVGAADLSLSTDGVWPPDLLELGYMDEVVRQVIDAGVLPADAIRMATHNPAEHFGLRDRGTLAPGKRADLVILDDLESVRVETVLSGGRVVVEDGDPSVEARPHRYPKRFTDCVNVSADPETFHISPERALNGRVRAIENREGLLTGETTVTPPVVDGNLAPDPENDLLKAALFETRPGSEGGMFAGFLTGLGLRAGAAATTITWEMPGLVVVGANEADMAAAVERVSSMGGGWAVVRDGAVLADLATPVAGVAADLPVEAGARRYEAIEGALRELGTTADQPMLAVQTLTFPGVPSLKLSFSGYADVFAREVVGLTPD